MILSKYIDKLPKTSTKFIIGRRYDGCISIYPDMEEIEQKKLEAFGKADPSSIGFLVFNAHKLKLNSASKQYEMDEAGVIANVIDRMLSSIKDFNRKNCGLRNHRMGGVHQLLKKMSGSDLYRGASMGLPHVIDIIDRVTIIYMLVGASGAKEEINDAINDLKSTHSKAIERMDRGYYDR